MLNAFNHLHLVVQVLLVACIALVLVNQNACNRFIRIINATKKLFDKNSRRITHKRSPKRKKLSQKSDIQ